MKEEIEGLILATQDQSLPSRNYQANTIKNGSNQIRRVYEQKTEPVVPLVSSYQIRTSIEYKERHDKIGYYFH